MAGNHAHAVGLAKFLATAVLVLPLPTYAFPPYRSTDAETADPWTLEVRLGLVRIEREANQNVYSSPLLRLNFGLPANVEVVSELEYRPVEKRVADAALGFKWIPIMRRVSLGIETLALLPVSRDGGAGVEASLLVTFRTDPVRVHVNASGFHDARPSPAEQGWKTGAIAELLAGRFRPGIEAFAKEVGSGPVAVLAGPGVIVDVGPVDIRAGATFGLTQVAPDLVASLWVTGKLPVR